MNNKKITELEYLLKNNNTSINSRLCEIAYMIKNNKNSCFLTHCYQCEFYRNKEKVLEIVLSEHQEHDSLIKLGFEKTGYKQGDEEIIAYFHREHEIAINFYPDEKQYYIDCNNVDYYITPEINNAIQEKLKELKFL